MLIITRCCVEPSTVSTFLSTHFLKCIPFQIDAVPVFKWATLYILNELFPVKNCVDVNLRWQERHQSQLGVTGMF